MAQMMNDQSYEIHRHTDKNLENITPHHHDFYEIYHLVSGSVSFLIEGRRDTLCPGDTLLISPEKLHHPIITNPNEPFDRFVLWISDSCLQEMSTKKTDLRRGFNAAPKKHSNLIRTEINKIHVFRYCLEQLLLEKQRERYGSDILCQSHLSTALSLICREALLPNNINKKQKSSTVIDKILHHINDHYQEDLSLEEISNDFYVSKYYLSHLFKDLVGCSMYQYILQKRLQMAKIFLKEGEMATNIYTKCGFKDYSNFYRAFRAEYQMSPKEYMQSKEIQKNKENIIKNKMHGLF
jgi:AraC-like DNA-binding protein